MAFDAQIALYKTLMLNVKPEILELKLFLVAINTSFVVKMSVLILLQIDFENE